MPITSMHREPLSGINVLVVGAGMAGLYAAIELYRQGHSVTVVESKGELDQSGELQGYLGQSHRHFEWLIQKSGDLLGIGVSVTKQFDKWPGMPETYRSILYQPVLDMFTPDGTFICGGFRLSEHSQYRPVPVHRPKLSKVLYDYVVSLDIPVIFGKRVVDYTESDETNQAFAITDQGESFAADIVVAADGIGTKVWSAIGGKEVKPISSGFSVYRAAYPTEVLRQDPYLRDQYPFPPGQADYCQIYVGPGANAIILVSPELTTWLFMHRDNGQAMESWATKHDASAAMATLKDSGLPWDEKLKAIIARTPPGHIVDFKISWRDPDPMWTSQGGRIVKIGDAAHAFIPNSTNGATQAMEDGISLAACLRLGTKRNIPLATRIHTKLRFERASCAQKRGFATRDKWNTDNFEALKNNPEDAVKSVGRWIWTHDAEQYVYENWESCLNHLLVGTAFKNNNIPPGYDYQPWTLEELMSQDHGALQDPGDWD